MTQHEREETPLQVACDEVEPAYDGDPELEEAFRRLLDNLEKVVGGIGRLVDRLSGSEPEDEENDDEEN